MDEGRLHNQSQYYGISGWLIFIVLSLIFIPITSFIYIFGELTGYFQPEIWHALTTYGTDLYHPLYAPWIIYELILMDFLS
jgi:hypothetical protein